MGYDWPLCGYWSLRCRHCWLCFLLPQFSCAHVKLILILRFYCIMGWVLNMFICLFLFYFCFRYIHAQAPFRFLSSENPDNRMCVCVCLCAFYISNWLDNDYDVENDALKCGNLHIDWIIAWNGMTSVHFRHNFYFEAFFTCDYHLHNQRTNIL